MRREFRLTEAPTEPDSTVEIGNGDIRRLNGLLQRKLATGKSFELRDFDLKFAQSIEEPVTGTVAFEPIFRRLRRRWSAPLPHCRLDLTHVVETYNDWQRGTYPPHSRVSYDGQEYYTKYETDRKPPSDPWRLTTSERWEVELELEKTITEDELLDTVRRILIALTDSCSPMLYNDRNNMYSWFANIYHSASSRNAISEVLSRARTLTLRDLVSLPLPDQVIGSSRSNTGFRLTHKADGERCLLIVDKVGIWRVIEGNPNDVALLSRSVAELTGLVLEAELMSIRNSRRPLFLVYDALGQPGIGRSDCRMLLHSARMTLAETALPMLAELTPQVDYSIKSMRAFLEPGQFFDKVKELLAQQANGIGYATDGLLLVQAGVYTNSTIYKWKPADRQSIDFALEPVTQNGLTQYYPLVNLNRRLVRFNGSRRYPARDVPVDIGSFEYRRGLVYECLWVPAKSENGIEIPNHWKVDRVRVNKPTPNAADVADKIWSQIARPLTTNELTGEKTKVFLSEAQNTIKTDLLRTNEPGMVLLDLGSGNGGDINRWSNYEHIYAVEPDETKVNQRGGLRDRVAHSDLANKVTIIVAGAQDTEVILRSVKRRVDVVSFMWTLPLIAHAGALRQALITAMSCLKPEGRIVWLCYDGQRVLDRLRSIPVDSDLGDGTRGPVISYNIGSWAMTRQDVNAGRDGTRELRVTLLGIVGTGQLESLIFFDELTEMLESQGFGVSTVPVGKYFMTPQEAEFHLASSTGSARWRTADVPLLPALYSWRTDVAPPPARLTVDVATIALPKSKTPKVIDAPLHALLGGKFQLLTFLETGTPGNVIYRLGCDFGDNNSIFHAILYAISRSYREALAQGNAFAFVSYVRRWFARRALAEYPTYEDGIWPNAFRRNNSHIVTLPDIATGRADTQLAFDFSVRAINNAFTANKPLPWLLFDFLAITYGIQIVTLRYTIHGRYVHTWPVVDDPRSGSEIGQSINDLRKVKSDIVMLHTADYLSFDLLGFGRREGEQELFDTLFLAEDLAPIFGI